MFVEHTPWEIDWEQCNRCARQTEQGFCFQGIRRPEVGKICIDFLDKKDDW